MNTREIRKLRRKFIAIAMISYVMVTFFIGIVINLGNYIVTQGEVNWSLEELLEKREEIESQEDAYDDISGNMSMAKVFSPSYISDDYYIITYNAYGQETEFLASWDRNTTNNKIRARAEGILSSGHDSGKSGMYYYKTETDEDGNTTIAMIDAFELTYSRYRLGYMTVIVGVSALVITLILVMILSKRMIQPEIEMSKKQMQFLTNVSHELKTPLAVIRSNAEMEEMLNGENEFTQSTIRQVDRMNGLIKNLVMITKSREMENSDFVSEIDLSKAVSDSAKEFQSMAEAAGKGFEVQIEEDIRYTADESKIRQLVMILLDNAIKYCDDNGNIFVSLEKKKRGRGAKLTVSNSYAEGSNADCARFFDRFYREDESHNIDTGGYGIGLSIAESVCSQYGGSIHAEWSEGIISFICEI